MEKVVSSPLKISQKLFHIGQVMIKKYGLKTLVSAITSKKILRCLALPIDQANLFAYSCIFTLPTSYTNGMLDQNGEGCQNVQKINYYKS